MDELARLIAWPTVSNRPLEALAAHLATRAEEAGFRVERFAPPGAAEAGKCSVVASIGPVDDVAGGLCISGHMDVVPTEGQPWDSDPFRLTERDGVLYGRGTADMKGFLAAVVVALGRIPASAYRKPVVLVWTHDEEVGCLGSAAMAQAWAGRPFPAACWIGEPTDFRILRMHPGHVAVEVEVRGRAAHSSRPDLGLNAVEGAADIVVAARQLARDLAGQPAAIPELERPWVALNVAEIQGGRAVNIVPDRCVLKIGYRPLPGQDPLEVHHALAERIAALKLPHPVEPRVLRVSPAMLTPLGTPLEGALAEHAAAPGCGRRRSRPTAATSRRSAWRRSCSGRARSPWRTRPTSTSQPRSSCARSTWWRRRCAGGAARRATPPDGAPRRIRRSVRPDRPNRRAGGGAAGA
ncbi:MAG: M20/M25/M40 family metallo-hydrolase [Myxococcota bacterium]